MFMKAHKSDSISRYGTIMILLFMFCMTTVAQPSAVKNASKSVFTLTTFDKNGQLIASSHGVFIGTNGECLSLWKPFVGAYSAVVIDTKGKRYEVETLLGANDLYNMCKFSVKTATLPLTVAATPEPTDSKVWLSEYALKKPKSYEISISKVEMFMEKYAYYIFNDQIEDNLEGCPVLNNDGQLLGLIQESTITTDHYAVDANLNATFHLTGLSINDATMNKTFIRTALPDDQDAALLTLMMAKQKGDSLHLAKYIDDFIEAFPKANDGYFEHAQQELAALHFSNAAADMERAISIVDAKDEAHSNYARIIFNKLLYIPDTTYTDWTYEKARAEVQQAYSINPLPVYKQQEAEILKQMGQYEEAYNMFMQLANSSDSYGELYYQAALCKTQLNAPNDEIIALLDSAISVQTSGSAPIQSAAPYYLARARMYNFTGQYRKAMLDYNEYDTLMLGRVTHDFFYERYKCELNGKLFQQAMNDIMRAIILNRAEPVYYAELASLQLRVKEYEDAVKTCDMLLAIRNENTDAYIIKGLALGELNHKDEAIEAFRKAKELGDERADAFIEKYK